MRPPEGLLFDLGNTLLCEERFDVEAGTEHVLALARNPRKLTARDVCERVRELDADFAERRLESWLEISPFAVHRLVYEPNEISFDRPFPEVELAFWRAATRFSATEGIVDLLEDLSSAGLPLGVVSNSTFTSETLRWQLGDSGLGTFFRFVMSSADYVVRKPHPVIFEVAAKKLGVAPERIWFVGDSLEFDVRGSARAGMIPVWYDPEHRGERGEAEIVVAEWRDLARLIEH